MLCLVIFRRRDAQCFNGNLDQFLTTKQHYRIEQHVLLTSPASPGEALQTGIDSVASTGSTLHKMKGAQGCLRHSLVIVLLKVNHSFA